MKMKSSTFLSVRYINGKKWVMKLHCILIIVVSLAFLKFNNNNSFSTDKYRIKKNLFPSTFLLHPSFSLPSLPKKKKFIDKNGRKILHLYGEFYLLAQKIVLSFPISLTFFKFSKSTSVNSNSFFWIFDVKIYTL